MAKLTYLPDDGDPAKVTWNGHVFEANVGKEVRNAYMVDLAKGNRFFKVEDADKVDKPDPKTKALDRERDRVGEYKKHAVAWINAAESHLMMAKQWASEERMREEHGVGTEDIDWLMTLYTPKFEQLKRAFA